MVAELIKSLPSLPTGDAWFWAPVRNLLQRVKVRARLTFDSGRTPKSGERIAPPKVLAPVDLVRLGSTMAASVERAKESDPKALRADVLRLRQEVEQLRAAPAAVTVERVVEQAYLDEDLKALRIALGVAADAIATILGRAPPSVSPVATARIVVPPAPRRAPSVRGSGPGDPTLASGERKILTALAQYPGGRNKRQLAVLTGYAHGGGGFNNYLSALKGRSFIDRAGDQIELRDAGLEALGAFTPLPTGRALFEHWLAQLGKAEREILRVLFEEYPNARPKEYVATKAGYAPDGGGFNNALSRLRTLELIDGKAKLRSSPTLHEVR